MTIRPIEVIEPRDAARRAAGGFVLLGPLGAALAVLTGKGKQVLFELVEPDGTTRKGIVSQDNYRLLRKEIERMQDYKPGEIGKSIAVAAGFLLLLAIFVAATGPAGFVIAPVLWFGVAALLRKASGRKAAA
jgi:hypothetical protein